MSIPANVDHTLSRLLPHDLDSGKLVTLVSLRHLLQIDFANFLGERGIEEEINVQGCR